MNGFWELYNGDSNAIRHTGGGYRLVLECLTKGAEEMAGLRLRQIVDQLNQKVCACGKVCDRTGFCDDCFGE